MYFFLLDAIALPKHDRPEVEGFAVIWVDSQRYRDCERAALEFAGEQGLTVRGVKSAHQPTPADLETMSPTALSARTRGIQDGIWGYFTPQVDERASDQSTAEGELLLKQPVSPIQPNVQR